MPSDTGRVLALPRAIVDNSTLTICVCHAAHERREHHVTLATVCGMCVALSAVSLVRAADDVKITPDVVYGHKDGMALTFDVFTPQSNANGVGILFMVSGGWYSQWSPPENTMPMFKPLLDAGFTVFAVRHGSSPKFGIPDAVNDVRRSVRYIRANAESWVSIPIAWASLDERRWAPVADVGHGLGRRRSECSGSGPARERSCPGGGGLRGPTICGSWCGRRRGTCPRTTNFPRWT